MTHSQFRLVLLDVYTADEESPLRYFSALLTLDETKRMLRRMELFAKYQRLDANLHEMVFESGFEGGFHVGSSTKHRKEQAPDVLAPEMIVCGFSRDRLGRVTVNEDGQLRTCEDPGRLLVAVQWRGYDQQSNESIYSAPLWHRQTKRIKDDLTPSPC